MSYFIQYQLQQEIQLLKGRMQSLLSPHHQMPDSAFELDLNISQSGNYILWNAPRSIKTSTTDSETILTIKTHNDSTVERPGSITVAINESEDKEYRLGIPSSDTIENY